MADYIDRNILCQAYVHIDAEHLKPDELERLKRSLEAFVSSRGQFFLYEEVATNVELKEGSLKIYGTILGTLYVALSHYGNFRSSVDYLATDAKRLAECIASESLFLTKSRHDKTIRVEARVGVAGSLKNAVDRLERIREELGETPLSYTTRAIAVLEAEILSLMDNLNDPGDPPYIARELCKLVTQLLPEKPPSSPKYPNSSDGLVAAYQRARLDLVDSVKRSGKAVRNKH